MYLKILGYMGICRNSCGGRFFYEGVVNKVRIVESINVLKYFEHFQS